MPSPPTPTHRSMQGPLSLADGWLQVVSTHHASPREDVHPDEAGHSLDLVILDMDGTLLDGHSSWEVIHHALGVSNHVNWERYQRGELTDEEFMRADIEMWCTRDTRIHVADIEKIFEREFHLMPGARELVQGLRERGIATAIMSGGLDLVARKVCEATGIDMYVANGLYLQPTGHLAGDGICFVKINDKATPTRELLKKLGVRPERTAAVGNSQWDVPMFRECGFGVAFNPADEGVKAGAHVTIEEKDMRLVLPHLLDYRPGDVAR